MQQNQEHSATVIKLGREFSIFVFLSSFFPVVSVPLRGKGVCDRGKSEVCGPDPCVSVPLRGKGGCDGRKNEERKKKNVRS